MAKTSGTYPSLVRGVSQQEPESRIDGQHAEQINMWSDPVRGLVRRRGTTLQYSDASSDGGEQSVWDMSGYDRSINLDYLSGYRTINFTYGGRELVVMYPSRPRLMETGSARPGPGIRVVKKLRTEGPVAEFGQVSHVNYNQQGGAELVARMERGFCAAAQVGRFLLLMPNNTRFPSPDITDAWGAPSNNTSVFWIKQGVASTTYTINIELDGVTYTATYTTPSSSYTGTLDTSDIPYDATDYVKQINDRVNAYNSAVTAWITTAAEATRPSYIASQLGLALETWVTTVGGFVYHVPDTGYLGVGEDGGRTGARTITDSRGGSLTSVSHRTVYETSDLPAYHWPGHIVQIKGKERGDSTGYYMKAVRSVAGGAGPVAVRWEESAATAQAAPPHPFVILAMSATGSETVGIGIDQDSLRTATGDPGLTLPDWGTRRVGDHDSSPIPYFFNRQITWMGMFQDRLCVAADNVVSMSETGNYFNYYRTATNTVPDSDPVEIYSVGSETDVIRHGVFFDRSLVLFGDKQQYSIDGRLPITPSSTTVVQSGAIEGATTCPPVAGGNKVFFAKQREESTEVFQMDVGNVQDTSNFTGLGMQLADYLPGKPVQLLYISSPSMLVVRVSGAPCSVFIYRFLDQGNQRLMDSWSRFDYGDHSGPLLGMFQHQDALIYLISRQAYTAPDGYRYTLGRGDSRVFVVDRQSLLTDSGYLPYLDSMRDWGRWTRSGGSYGADIMNTGTHPLVGMAVAQIDGSWARTKTPYWLYGVDRAPNTYGEFQTAFHDIPSGQQTTLWTNYCKFGWSFQSSVTLTSPVVKDRDGQPVGYGQLTVSKLTVDYTDTGGLQSTTTSRYGLTTQYNGYDWVAEDTAYGTTTALRFNGRILGQAPNMVGVIPVTDGSVNVFIGRNSKEYECTLASRNWMPLTISRVAWQGQWFKNYR